jgi:cobyrinic acid a,c-diamide synthase
MLSRKTNMDSFARHTGDADIAVVEGVMGLFDGYDGRSEAGSTAQMAKWLGLPVLLVVDAGSMARSAAALVQGFEGFDRELNFAGVVFNQIGSSRHLTYLTDALKENVQMPCLGGVIRNEELRMPERHLGLVTREDHELSPENIESLADLVEESIQVDRLLKALPNLRTLPVTSRGLSPQERRVKIGVARDRAFCFYYQDNLEILEGYGAELVSFSPVSGRPLPDDLDGIYLGGGYPELSAEALSANTGLRKQILELSLDGMPIYGECGGFMFLCREMVDATGKVFPMTGCFPFRTLMHSRLRSLGYREIMLSRPALIGNAGIRARGHEFHYSALDEPVVKLPLEKVFSVSARAGLKQEDTGYQTRRTLGSYIHLHFGSRPEVAGAFVEKCLTYQMERKAHS